MKKVIITLLTIAIGIGIKIYEPNIVEILKLKGFDQLLTLNDTKTSETAVIIEIDEPTIEQQGQWPWPRDLIADGIKKAVDHGAEIVVLYPLFAEKDRFNKDEILKEVITNSKVIGTQSASLKGKGDLVTRGFAIVGNTEEQWFYRYQNGIGSISEISKTAQGMGMITTVPELDGVTRKIPLVLMVGDKFYPSLPLEIARVIHGAKNYRAKVTEAGLSSIYINKNFSIEPDKRGELWIDWSWTWPIKSWKEESWGDLTGKIAILAINVEGITNTIATPAGTKLGHEVSLAAWETLWNDNKITRPYWADLTELLFFCMLIAVSALVADKGNKLLVGVWGVVILLVPFSISYYVFNQYQYLTDWTFSLIFGTLFYGYVVYSRFVKEFKLKQQIKKKNVVSLIFWRNLMFKKVIKSFKIYKEDKTKSKNEYNRVSDERNLILSQFSNVYIKLVIKSIISKSSQEIDKKDKFVVNFFIQKSLKGFLTARRWFIKLRNLVSLRKINNTKLKNEEIKNEKPIILPKNFKISDSGKDYEEMLQNLRDIRNKKRPAPKVNKY